MTITRDDLESIVMRDVIEMPPDVRASYEGVALIPELYPILGDTRHEAVWVVARQGDQALWYDDVEEGFNVSRTNGGVVEPGYEQDSLGIAVWKWLHRPEI